MAILDDYLTLTEAARALKVSERTLIRWWTERHGPARTKVGHRVYYRRAAIDRWLAASETTPVRERGAA